MRTVKEPLRERVENLQFFGCRLRAVDVRYALSHTIRTASIRKQFLYDFLYYFPFLWTVRGKIRRDPAFKL